jgi:phage repressor protein C with HTH and peptisase S24 domain
MNKIREIRQKRGLTQAQLAEKMNTTAPQVVRLEKGQRRITLDWIRRFARALDVSEAEIAGYEYAQNDTESFDKKKSKDSTVTITELDVRAGAGLAEGALSVTNHTDHEGNTLTVEATRGNWEFPPDYVHELKIKPTTAKIIEVLGDSMEPTLRSGDRVLVDMADRCPSPPGVFALWDGFGIVVKRIEHLLRSDPPRLRITSDNPHHTTYDLTSDEVNIIGRIVWIGRRI